LGNVAAQLEQHERDERHPQQRRHRLHQPGKHHPINHARYLITGIASRLTPHALTFPKTQASYHSRFSGTKRFEAMRDRRFNDSKN
jgi:hypothetical protein